MLVLVADKLGRRQGQALHAMPSEQRFALSVLAAFALALTLLAVLFTFSAEPPPAAGRRQASNLMAQHSPAQPPPASPGDAGA